MHRFVEEEALKQKNIEDITNQAVPLLSENTDAGKMNDDWVINFFDKSRIVSDHEMQALWARVLAGEANSPGTYSKRTVNFLGDLDKVDAHLFSKLCGFGWLIGDVVPLIFEISEKIYEENEITFSALSHLESIGLIQFNSLSGFRRLQLPKKFHVLYYGESLQLEMPKEENNELAIGNVLLTKIGQELAPISGSKPVDGFREYVKEKWKAQLPAPASEQVS